MKSWIVNWTDKKYQNSIVTLKPDQMATCTKAHQRTWFSMLLWIEPTELNNIEVTRFKILSLAWFDAYANLDWCFTFWKIFKILTYRNEPNYLVNTTLSSIQKLKQKRQLLDKNKFELILYLFIWIDSKLVCMESS